LKEAGGPEWRDNYKNEYQQIAEELDPEQSKYQIPDFGFDDKLNTKESSMGIWDVLYDNLR
tara:strand:+ start:221 stop:403 length:183 start_codon:yes stop_codon:yes gene_type:complete